MNRFLYLRQPLKLQASTTGPPLTSAIMEIESSEKRSRSPSENESPQASKKPREDTVCISTPKIIVPNYVADGAADTRNGEHFSFSEERIRPQARNRVCQKKD